MKQRRIRVADLILQPKSAGRQEVIDLVNRVSLDDGGLCA